MVGVDPEKGIFTFEHEKTSSSGSDSSSSSDSSSTDPSSISPGETDRLPRIQHAAHSSTPPRRGNRRPSQRTPSRRLGAIDEHSPSIAPDVPARNPNRPKKMVSFLPSDATKFFSWNAYTRPGTVVPPPNAYEGVVGPNGEKFNDVRQNKPFSPPGAEKRRRLFCLGSIILVVLLVIALAIGLGVGLTRNKGNRSNATLTPISSPNDTAGANSNQFPIGTYAIQTYLATTSSNCTSNPSTWRCYPYSTYPQSNTLSFNTLQWRISSPTGSTINLEISNTNSVFSYPFTNVSLNLVNTNDVRLSAFAFDFTYRKQVVPAADITGDNGATRCYYNNTKVNVKLYSDASGAGGNIQGPPAGQNVTNLGAAWPYAVEFEEVNSGGPECFRYANGQEGARVQVPAGTGSCACDYRNFGLS